MPAAKSPKPARKIREGAVSIFLAEGVFYNPEMEFCRDISSIAVGAIAPGAEKGEKFNLVDAMCASGVRGIRYAKENSNIAAVTFVDSSKHACALAKKNAKANKVKTAKVIEAEVNEFFYRTVREDDVGIIEIDPFGTPAPFIHSAFHALRHRASAYLSLTATDTAVLCGAHPQACLKNYQARPLDNEYCHEIAIRILLGKAARTASDFNFGIAPLLSLSRQHFVKVLVRSEKGAEHATQSIEMLGYISHCQKCLHREWREGTPANDRCPHCKSKLAHAGPLWLGPLFDAKFLQAMRKLNEKRKYANKEKLDALLALMLEESALPPTYFDLHCVSQNLGVSAVGMEPVISSLQKAGFKISKTHFRHNSVRTDAKISDVAKAVRAAAPSQPRRK